ncbi:hypothetical protein [Endozoicomonas sp. ALB032]|uniref:hypothetical protein n=1 Tax=Endozoicomonas sp. ALB032 TaxID=3403082 RepID=UPI003BB7D314
MKKLFNLFPLLLCLFYSTAQAGPPSKNDFDFLEPFNDSALVANGLELAESIAGVSLSTLLNLGIWWGVCKTAGIVSGLSGKYDLAASDTKELEELKADFCLQLAPVITTAEVALAGHVSPWPLEQLWWRPLYFAGAGMTAYIANTKTRGLIPVAVLTYLASEAVSRTGASAMSALILRTMNVKDITTEWYVVAEYSALSMINGVMLGGGIYESKIRKGFRHPQATIAAVFSAANAGALSGIISKLVIYADKKKAGVGAGAGIGAAALTVTIIEIGVLYGLVPGASIGVVSGALAGALAGAVSGAIVGAKDVAGGAAGIGVGVAVGLGASALGGFGALLMSGSSKLTSNNPFIKAGVTLSPALAFAVINSFSNYAVYGYPLEQGFSENSWTQWKKFYAPLDYFSTLSK